MSEITVVEFEQRQAHLSSELADGPPYTVHGIALGSGDVTRGASGVKKKWPEEELKKAAESLEGKNLVEDHNNDSSGVIGKVTKAGFKEGVGVLYEAELFNDDLAEKISNGLLEVSVRGYHKDVDEMEETEDGAKIVEDIQFDNLSVVPSGASPSNTLEMGPAEELSVAALSDYVSTLSEHKMDEDVDDDMESEQQEEVEAGDFVQWGDKQGVVLTMPEDGEVEVDVYEESDGTFRAVGETEMVSVDDLSSWDVDPDEDIGAAEKEDDSEEEESDEEEDEEAETQEGDVPEEHRFKSEDEAASVADDLGISGAHEMEFDGETMWVPGASHDEYLDAVSEQGMHGDEESDEEEGEMQSDEVLAQVEEFVAAESEEAPLSKLAEWSDSDALMNAVNDYTRADGKSLEDSVADFAAWYNSPNKDEEEMRAEGEEEVLDTAAERKRLSSEARNPDGAFDDEYEEASADEGSDEESDVEESTSAVETNESDEGRSSAELQEWEFHEPSWDGTTEDEWSSPDMEDFDTDDLGEIADHFLISQTGFPSENFTDLALPVVEPNGDLNVNALSAVKGGRGVSAVEGLSDDMEEQIVDYVNGLANEHFDRDWGMEEASVTGRDVPSDDAEPTHRMDPDVEDDHEAEQMDPVSAALDLINIFLRANGRDERDSVDKMLGWLFSSTDVPTEKMAAFRIAANAFLDQQGGTDSFDAVDVESFRSWLLTQGGQTDDGVHARPTEPTAGRKVPRIATPVHVLSGDDLRTALSVGASKKDELTNEDTNMTDIEEELAELDEPVAVEKSDFESLQEKAENFDDMSENIEALRERTEVLDSVDREQVEELAESEDPVVLETDEYEELTAEAEQVKAVYAEALSSEGPFSADDLVDKFSIEELREKYEEAGHDLEEELSAEPRSGDVDEEELEERAEEENKSEEELAQEEAAEQKRAELREKILGN